VEAKSIASNAVAEAWRPSREAALKSRPCGAQKFAQRRHIRPVAPHAPGIDRQPEHFGLLDAQPRIIKLREAIAFGGRQAIPSRRCHRTWRAVIVPPLPNNIEEVVPVSAIPHNFLPRAPDAVYRMQLRRFGFLRVSRRAVPSLEPIGASPGPISGAKSVADSNAAGSGMYPPILACSQSVIAAFARPPRPLSAPHHTYVYLHLVRAWPSGVLTPEAPRSFAAHGGRSFLTGSTGWYTFSKLTIRLSRKKIA
jgi:hypothetical protein